MDVIENGVRDIGFGQDRRQLGFPHTFGKPSAGRAISEMALDVVRELDDLLVLVRRRDRNQNGLVKAAAHHLDLAFGDVHARVSLEDINEWQIAASVGLLENMIEIANGLVRVDEKNQMELWRHGNGIGLLNYSITCRARL
jgi:hypothetical protein